MSIYLKFIPYDHRLKDVLVLESNGFFSKMVDELVEFSEYDPELSDGIKWLDEQNMFKHFTTNNKRKDPIIQKKKTTH